IVLYVRDDSANAGVGDAFSCHDARHFVGIEDLVIVSDSEVRGIIFEITMAAEAAAIFDSGEINFLAAQTAGIEKQIDVFADEIRNGVNKLATGGFEGLHGFEARVMAESPDIVLL